MRLRQLGLLIFAYANIAPSLAYSSPAPSLAPCPSSELVGEGDTIKLFVFERIASRDEDWTKSREAQPAGSSFVLRSEVSGEMSVGADGFIFLPLLGNIKVAGASPASVSRDIGEKFKEIFGQEPRINLAIAHRKPVFVVGHVKNPGRYDYMQGMTLMHAVAVAGGVLRSVQTSRGGEGQRYSIAREDREGMMEQAGADALSPLCPGDLVRIMQPD